MFNFKSLVVASALTMALTVPSVAGSGGVDNGGFESPLAGTWLGTNQTSATAVYQNSGDYSAVMGASSTLSQLVWNLLENTAYTLSFSVLLDDGALRGNLFYGLVGGTAGFLGTTGVTVSQTEIGDDGWNFVTLDFTTANNIFGDYVSSVLTFITSRRAGVNTYIDDVSIALTTKGPPIDVPGPIAGAGLPMLVAGAAWLYRRRKAAV